MHRLTHYYAGMPNKLDKRLREILGDNVKAIRKHKKLSQPAVSQRALTYGLKIDQTTVGRVENKKHPAGVETIEALAKGLGVEPWHLFSPDLKPDALPVATPQKPTKADIEKVEKIKQLTAEMTPVQRELFVNSEEGKKLVPHYASEKMDERAWSAASKAPSRLRG